MTLSFPADPAAQTPANTYSPTSTPEATDNGVTYIWDGSLWNASSQGFSDIWSRFENADDIGIIQPSDFSDRLEVGGDGLCVIGRKVGVGMHPTTQIDAQLQVGGNADVAGNITTTGSGKFTGKVESDSYFKSTRSDASQTVFQGYQGDTLTTTINANGSIAAENKIVINSGSVNAGDDRTRLQIGEGAGTSRELALLYTTDSSYQGPGLKIQHRNSTNDNAKFLQCVEGTSTVAEIGLDGSIDSASSVSTGAFDSTDGFAEGVDITRAGEVYVQCASSKANDFRQLAGYYGKTSKWDIKADGTGNFKTTLFNLEPDNPDNYVNTTNADGETESVYSGPQLDVKALLLEFQSKIATLEAKLAALSGPSTTDIQEGN